MANLDNPRLGDQLYRVEWCKALAFDASGDVDRDRCKMAYKYFKNTDYARAREFAEGVWPQTQATFGVVELDLIQYVPYDQDDAGRWPHVGFWEQCIPSSEIFSGMWETT